MVGAGVERVDRFAVGNRPPRKPVHFAEFLDCAGELLVERLGIGTVLRQPKSASQERNSRIAAARFKGGPRRYRDLRQLRPAVAIPRQSIAEAFIDRIVLLQRLDGFNGIW